MRLKHGLLSGAATFAVLPAASTAAGVSSTRGCVTCLVRTLRLVGCLVASLLLLAAPASARVGMRHVGAATGIARPGRAWLFVVRATGTAKVDRLSIFIDGRSRAHTVILGLYADTGRRRRLARCSIRRPHAGAWSSCRVRAVKVTSRTAYRIGLLAPARTSGRLVFRSGHGGAAYRSRGTSLRDLPARWANGEYGGRRRASLYASRHRHRGPKQPRPDPTPTPAPRDSNCMPQPSACGFPDITNTGVNPLIPRKTVSGTVVLDRPGQVYEDRTVNGSILVEAPNVTIRNVKIVSSDWYPIRTFEREGNTGGLLVEDVEIDMGRNYDAKAIAYDHYTLRRAFIHNGADCAHLGDDVVIEDTLCVLGPDANGDGWPDSTSFCNGTEHFDGFQSDGGHGYVIRHNTIRNPCSQTSAILMSTNTSPIRDVTIQDNLLGGGGYALYCNAGPDLPDETVTGNRFARTWYRWSGHWGAWTGCEDADVFSGNVWDDTGTPAR